MSWHDAERKKDNTNRVCKVIYESIFLHARNVVLERELVVPKSQDGGCKEMGGGDDVRGK